ncbi:MAG TPA: hypothetical protein VH639_12435 [Bryobacteraceae bacterium]
MRSGAEFNQIRRYIEWNPVKAGLVASPEDFPWSSAYKEGGLQPARGFSPASSERG